MHGLGESGDICWHLLLSLESVIFDCGFVARQTCEQEGPKEVIFRRRASVRALEVLDVGCPGVLE